ncbi:MAG: tripartite tricarboxylate transporter substrate binding protein [Betaproteobacteria bacterium]
MKYSRAIVFAVCGVLMLMAMAMAPGSALAQPYPNRPVKMIIAFPPGGTSDFVGRIVAAKLGEFLSQQVVVDNRGGATGLIGTQAAAKSAADGYTILLAPSDFTLVPSLQESPPYDPLKDFAPVGMVLDYPHVLVATASLPASNAKELIALAKAKPGQINYASGGNGGTNHISGEWFKSQAGIDLTHVPYKGNGPAITDLLADRVQLLFTSTGPVEGHLKTGKLKAIAVTGKTRLPSLPDTPTIAESAIPGYEFTLWYGIVVPAGTPRPIIERLNADLRKTMESAEVKERLASLGGNLRVGSPEEFDALMKSEVVRWRKLAKDTGIKVE